MQLNNDLILRAAKGQPTERVPVWLMRQAGRVLPEYRAVREKVSGFIELCTTPELAAEVTLQPVDIFGVDAAIIFSDILVIPEAMGLPYEMIESRGPLFRNPIQHAADIERLRGTAAAEHLGYVYEAIRISKKELNQRVPLIGFAGAPWTILAYMVEGQGSKTFSKARRFLYSEPKLAHQLLEKITEATIAYLKEQINAGADLIQLFDSWAGILGPDTYKTFSAPYLKAIMQAIPEVPKTIFALGAAYALEDIADCGPQVIGLDWHTEPSKARALVGPSFCFQGNLDPCALFLEDKELVKAVENMLAQFKGGPHIANLGHGLYPELSKEKVKLFVDTIKQAK
jgi:uroporphyrinogen decarboxylase